MSTTTWDNLTLSQKEFQHLSDLVYDYCGINLHQGKRELVRARLNKLVRAGGFSDFSSYMDHVMADSSRRAFSKLIDAICTNLTSFFRESQHFDYLRQVFLPERLRTKSKAGKRRLRAWSAGCSSGEEPYSIAMTLLESLDMPSHWDMAVLATDVSTRILEFARQGIYPKARVGQIPNALLSRYWQKQGHGADQVYQAGSQLKDLIVFRHLNLMEEWPVRTSLDFIFCRNVMIYFDKATQEKLVNRYWQCLDRGGLLFTGHSESLAGIEHSFKYVQPTIYMKA